MAFIRSILITGLAAATLVACGGSDDPPSSPVDGSYVSSSCEAFASGVYHSYLYTYAANLSKLTEVERFYTINTCTGSPAASKTRPDSTLISSGTKSVPGLTSSSTLTAYKVTENGGTGAYLFSSEAVRASTTPGKTDIKIGSNFYSFDSEVTAPAVNSKHILVPLDGFLYIKPSGSAVDADGYPTGVDFTSHLTKQ